MTTLTYYSLFLGEQDSVTGHYQRGFTIHSIVAYIYPRNTAINLDGLRYTRYGYTMFTEYEVTEGSVAYDAEMGRYFEILSKKPWPATGDLEFYECEVEEMTNFPFIAGFFGFEDEAHGLTGYGFEDGFERGYWAI